MSWTFCLETLESQNKKLKNYRILQDFFLFTDMFQIFKTGFKIRILVLKYSIVQTSKLPNFQTSKLPNFQTSCNPVKSCKIEIHQHYKIFTEFQFYRIFTELQDVWKSWTILNLETSI